MAQFKEIMALRLDNRSYSNIAAALGCSNRDIAKVQAIIDDHINNGRRVQIGDYDMRRHLAQADREESDHDS
ncbi:hypothetical protein [Corynebacterium sp. A21]|uniref:hypothetical protein n=1 Tax=Corynebacterium sp. A21 TaxID=3457318 RepID=UPI003FD2DD17